MKEFTQSRCVQRPVSRLMLLLLLLLLVTPGAANGGDNHDGWAPAPTDRGLRRTTKEAAGVRPTALATSNATSSAGPVPVERRAAVSATNGFCRTMKLATCLARGKACSSSTTTTTGMTPPQCCPLLKCQSGVCRSFTCTGATRECTSSSACCGRVCVTCRPECQGRCGQGTESPRDDIQTFYYPWYANPTINGKWRHWNEGGYDPVNKDISSPFYPKLDTYSCSDPVILATHMQWIKEAGIGTIIVSWWGQGSFEDNQIWTLLNAADDWDLKVGFYIEPYKGGYVRPASATNQTLIGTRTPQTARDDVKYIMDTYGCHRALYRRDGRPLFMFYAAREYMKGVQTGWKQVWGELHTNPRYNPIVIAHDTNLKDRIIAGGWDGGHVYDTFAAKLWSTSWSTLTAAYAAAGKILYFTVSPGYDKSRLPNVTDPILDRLNGQFYETLWARAKASRKYKNPVVITSFNEWHEGTQIEPAVPLTIPPYIYNGQNRSNYTYVNYENAWCLTGDNASLAYLNKTKVFADAYLAA